MVDQIFSYAELGFQEVETSKYVTGILEKNGFKVERGVAGIPTAWVASYGSGKPVIAFITDIDCIPRASQKPGVAYHDPIIDGAPGHGEGHNSGMAVNVTAALVLKGLSPGAALVFLLAGPATNIGSLVVLTKFLGARIMAIYLASIVVVTLLAGFALNWVYRTWGLDPRATFGAATSFIPEPVKIGSVPKSEPSTVAWDIPSQPWRIVP